MLERVSQAAALEEVALKEVVFCIMLTETVSKGEAPWAQALATGSALVKRRTHRVLVPKSSDRAVTDVKACRKISGVPEIGGEVTSLHLDYLKCPSFVENS